MSKQHGFTITELMFAVSILAIVLLVLLGSIIQMTRIYDKGITLKRVNQSGRTVGEELTRAIRLSGTTSIYNLASTHNRVCFGSNSFVWVNDQSPDLAKTYNRYNSLSGQQVTGFVKISGENMCNSDWGIRPIPESKATQLLGGSNEGDGDGLVMREVSVGMPSNSKLVSVKYVISTPSESLIDAERCGGDDDFCALNQFNVTVYARGY